MEMISLDTLSIVKRFRAAGISQKQAEAHASVLGDVLINNLATKNDLARVEASLKQDIVRVEEKFTMEIQRLDEKMDHLDEKIGHLDERIGHLDEKMGQFVTKDGLNAAIQEAKTDILKWMFGGFLTMFAMLVGILIKIS